MMASDIVQRVPNIVTRSESFKILVTHRHKDSRSGSL